MARPKGSINKGKVEFRKALRKYAQDRNADPHYWMVDLMCKKGVRYELKLQAAKELAQYLEPKLRAVEVSGDPEHPIILQLQERLLKAHERIEHVRLTA